jgi:signal transduction histidine kinase
VVLGAIWYIYRLRISKLLELQSMREHIARDLHDEIGSSLSSIAIYSKVAMSEPNKTVEEIKPVIERISDSSQRMLEATSDIVWAINVKNDTYKNLVQRMRATAIELTEALGMELQFDIDEKILSDYVSMEKRRNLFLIFKEACNNCVKYSKAKKLHISLQQRNGKCELEISDDGKGFDVDQIDAGNGLLNMKARAAQIGGKLSVESGPGAGTSVKVIFS